MQFTLSIDSFSPENNNLFYQNLCKALNDPDILIKNLLPISTFGNLNSLELIRDFSSSYYIKKKIKIQANNNTLTCFTVSTNIGNFKTVNAAEKEIYRKLYYFRKVLNLENKIISALVFQNQENILTMYVFVMPIITSTIYYANQWGEYPKLKTRLCSREFDRFSIQEQVIALNNYQHKHQKTNT